MKRPYGKEILEIEGKIIELTKEMDQLLIKRAEIEELREKENQKNKQNYI